MLIVQVRPMSLLCNLYYYSRGGLLYFSVNIFHDNNVKFVELKTYPTSYMGVKLTFFQGRLVEHFKICTYVYISQ